METIRHELFDELEAFDPRWQERYRTIAQAAAAAKATALYEDWLKSEHGQFYLAKIASAHDHTTDNEIRRAQLHAELAMASRGRATESRGFITEADEV